ncbi:MAG: hypothetical protein RBT34_09410 [Anaerolineaceae bacterium]|jgi:hypothetical protein|nr:hypothetical protein [Anaerolineaceae bacterium]
MDFKELLALVEDEPVFETGLLLAGSVDVDNVRLQLGRWTKSGKLYQLRRGLYALAPPYQKVRPHPFLVANRLQRASYVSCQSALSFYGLIPEIVQVTTSVTTGRPAVRETLLGRFSYRHVKLTLLRGYRMLDFDGQQALVARPEKALLDLVYLASKGDTLAYLRGLRLQNLDRLDVDVLHEQAEVFGLPKMGRAVEEIESLMQIEREEYVNL